MREETILTPEWVAQKQSFLDWDTQPSMFKHYPHFCYRVKLADHLPLKWLEEIRRITDVHSVAGKPYRRLNIPSAGNLHPIEIYIQLRNVSGLLSGVYHLDVLHEELVLIREIAGEGIEPYVGLEKRFSGAIVMFSLVPFRSYWKYGLRSWRYLYLDLGHQLGVFGGAVRHFGLTLTKMSPSLNLNTIMGLGSDEIIGAVYGIGEETERLVKPLKEPLMRVQPTDYTETMERLSSELQHSLPYTEFPQSALWDDFCLYNRRRRSAREFHPANIALSDLSEIMRMAVPDSLETITALLQAHSMQCGLYRHGECAVSENRVSEIVHLLLDQRFISGSNMVILIFGEEFTAGSHIAAGIYAQELYMKCEALGLGCTGIGAFYDELASGLSDRALLYAVAIGGK